MFARRRHLQRSRTTLAAARRHVALAAQAGALKPVTDPLPQLNAVAARNRLAFDMFRSERYGLARLAHHLSISETLARELIYQTLLGLNQAFDSTTPAPPQALFQAALRRLIDLLLKPASLPEQQAWQQAHPAQQQAWQRACALWHACAELPNSLHPTTRKPPLMWLSSVLLVCALGALMVWQQTKQPPLSTAKTFVLADASHVELAPFSSVELNSRGKHDLALTQGTMFVDNNRPTAQPLEIDLNTLVLRSQYSTYEIQNHPSITVINVLSGHVEVRLNTTHSPLVLLAGQQLRYVRSSAQLRIENYPIEHMALWRQGLFWVDNMPLAHSVEQLDRQLPGWTLIIDPTLAQTPVSGLFRTNQARQTLRTLLEPLGAQLEDYGPWLRVVRRTTP